MASQLKVDQLLNSSGGTFDGSQLGNVLPNGNSILLSTGFRTTTTTWTDFGQTITISPRKIGSKFIIILNCHVYVDGSSGNWGSLLTQILVNGSALPFQHLSSDPYGVGSKQADAYMGYQTQNYIYTTTSLSPVVISPQFRTKNGIQISINNFGYGSLTVMEIGA